MIIRRNGRYYTYHLTDTKTWSSTLREIVCIVQKRRTQADLSQKASYSLSVNLLFKDIKKVSLKRQESKINDCSKMQSNLTELLSSENNTDDDIWVA